LPCAQNAPAGLVFKSVLFLLWSRSRDSIVGIVTRLWAGWSGVRFLAGELDAEDFSLGLGRPGRGADLPYLCPFRLVECRCTSCPPVYLYGTHGGDFTASQCPWPVTFPSALMSSKSYLLLGVSDCHACWIYDHLRVAELISLKILDTNFETLPYAVFNSGLFV
jgi:hypothetical protein